MSVRDLTLLISSAGRRGALLQCFRQDATELGCDLKIIAVDLTPDLSATCQMADKSFAVPRCTNPKYIENLLEICKREKVKILIPTIDTELGIFSEHKDQFSEIGTHVSVPELGFVKVVRNKKFTADLLSELGILTPKTLMLEDFLAIPDRLKFPVVLKPVSGSSSVGIHFVENFEGLKVLKLHKDDYLAQERILGEEYTINLFFNRKGVMKCAIPHHRIETRGGEVSKGRTEKYPPLIAISEKMSRNFKGVRGAICYQAIVDKNGDAYVFEINARFGGGYPLAHRAGAKFSKWILEEALEVDSSAANVWEEGVLMLRYDAAVFKIERFQ